MKPEELRLLIALARHQLGAWGNRLGPEWTATVEELKQALEALSGRKEKDYY